MIDIHDILAEATNPVDEAPLLSETERIKQDQVKAVDHDNWKQHETTKEFLEELKKDYARLSLLNENGAVALSTEQLRANLTTQNTYRKIIAYVTSRTPISPTDY